MVRTKEKSRLRKATRRKYCPSCNLLFDTEAGLREHAIATGHDFCENCQIILEDNKAGRRHECCGKCQRICRTKAQLKRHQRLTGHGYCGDCDSSFPDDDSLAEHQRVSDHASEFRCCDCDKNFYSTFGLERHLERKKCKKNSDSTFGLEQPPSGKKGSKKSKKKKKKASDESRKLPCIGSGCTRRFKKPSHMIQHLESGVCRSRMTRTKLNSLVIAHDAERLISKPEDAVYTTLLEATKQLDGFSSTGGEWTPTTASELVVLTPPSGLSSTGGEWTPTTASELVVLTPQSGFTSTIPTPTLQNPPYLLEDGTVAQANLYSMVTRCPLCPASRLPFSKPGGLQAHLNSAAHAPRIFHCPAGLFRSAQHGGGDVETCGKKPLKYFKTLGGLAQHVEAGACNGGKEGMHKAVEYIEGRLMELGMQVKLLM